LEKSTQTAYQFTSCTSILGHTLRWDNLQEELAHNLKTEQDYTISKRMFRLDRFGNGLHEKRNGKRSSITKIIDGETNSAFAEMATPKIEDNLFYSAIKLMPDLFPESIKRFNSQVYGHNQRQTDSAV
jgi:hypothetical protein